MIIVPWRGILEITGNHDTGKTIAAMQTTNNTKDIVFVDDDVKGDGTVRQMKEQGMEFDLYIDLSKEREKLGNTPTADEILQRIILPTVEKIVEKKRKIIIWDTWRIVYQACRGHVERNQSKFSSVVTWRGNSVIIQGLISKVARMLEARILNELKASCDLLIITHHIKDNYVGGVAIGKIPESSATFNEVCNMRIWLRRNSRSKVPVMLFLKRPSLPRQTKAGIQFVNVVPLKITPTDKHQSIWQAIAEYEEKPIESRMPREDETPTAEELATISGTLTPEMQDYVKQMMAYNKSMEESLTTENDKPSVISKEDEEQENDVPQTAAELVRMANEQLGMDIKKVQDSLQLTFAQISQRQGEVGKFWVHLQEDQKGKDGQSKRKPAKK